MQPRSSICVSYCVESTTTGLPQGDKPHQASHVFHTFASFFTRAHQQAGHVLDNGVHEVPLVTSLGYVSIRLAILIPPSPHQNTPQPDYP